MLLEPDINTTGETKEMSMDDYPAGGNERTGWFIEKTDWPWISWTVPKSHEVVLNRGIPAGIDCSVWS